MALEVREIMNHELFSVQSGERAEDVLQYIVALGVSGAPVLDKDGRPLGFVAMRDLVLAPHGARVASRMSVPPDVIPTAATIQDAATMMAERSRHHLVCTDDDGRAVGFIGALDVIRGLLGRPVPHPDAFPHYDAQSGLVWSNDALLSFATAESAPAGPGAIVLIEAAPGRRNRVVWTEATENVQRRLREMLSTPATAPAHLVDAAVSGHLWFRCAPVSQALPPAER